MRHVTLPSSGIEMPLLGLGTWRMGERAAERDRELRAVETALDLGYRLIDTAEMYGEGGAEEIVGEAIAGKRDGLTIVSKVYPHNASRKGAIAACERSLSRLGIETIDVYLLHWPGSHPLEETFGAFEKLREAGKIRAWGVSNFDRKGMEKVRKADGGRTATNQIYYNLGERAADWDLMPWLREQGIPAMAYSPLDQGDILDEPALAEVGARHGATPAQVALAWILAQGDVVAIPKSADPARLKENWEAQDLALTDQDLADLEAAFPAPDRPTALGML